MKSTRMSILVLAALVAATISCGEDPPVPGTLIVALVTPNVSDGAILLDLAGPGLTTPQSASTSYALFARLQSAAQLRVAVLGDLTGGPLFTVSVPDVRDLSVFSGSVIEIANRTGGLRDGVVGYALEFTSSLSPQAHVTRGLTDPLP